MRKKNRKRNIFRAGIVAFMAVMFSIVPLAAFPVTANAEIVQVKISPEYRQTVARSMLPLLNSWRAGSNWYYSPSNTKLYKSGLKALTYDYTLERYAMQRAAEIAISFEHTRPKGDARTGISGYMQFGENIAASTNVKAATSEYAMTMFKEENKPYSGQGHRRMMLSVPAAWDAIGIACVYYKGCYYWVQSFGVTSKPDTKSTTAVNGNKTMSVDIESSRITSKSADLTNLNTWTANLQKGQTDYLPQVELKVGLAETWPHTQADTAAVPDWTSSNKNVVAIDSAAGTITAVNSGTASATMKEPVTGVSKSKSVTVTDPYEVTGVTLDKSSLTIDEGTSSSLTATVSPSTAGNKNVTWSSSNSSVATVSSTGVVKGLKAGTATITVKTVSGGKTASCKVAVKAKPVSGIVKENGLYKIYLNGVVNTSYTGLNQAPDGIWYYFKNGVQEPAYSGVAKSTNGSLYYVKNGVWNTTYTGLAQYNVDGKWYYVKAGRHVPTYTGITSSTNGQLYFAKNGVWDTTYTGLGQYSDGKWYYVKNGRHVPSYTGIAKSTNGSLYFARNGVWDTTYTGLGQYSDGKWYYVKNGRHVATYTGITTSTNGQLYFAKNGVWDTTYTGLGQYSDGKWYYVKNGRHVATYTGITTSTNGQLYFARNGVWDTTYTGLGQYSDGKWYYVRNGRYMASYTGVTVSTNGNRYYAKNGVWDTTFTGAATDENGVSYDVKSGRV